MVYKKRLREITKRENLLRAARGRKLWRIVIAHYCYVLYFTNMMFRFVSLMLYFCFVWPNNDIKYPIKSFKTKKLSVYLCFIRWYILVLQTVCNILVASLFSKILRRVRLFQSFFFVFFKKDFNSTCLHILSWRTSCNAHGVEPHSLPPAYNTEAENYTQTTFFHELLILRESLAWKVEYLQT